jgi:hypothetical protein
MPHGVAVALLPPAATALGAFHAKTKGWDLDLIGIVIDVDDCRVQTRMVEAVHREPAHARARVEGLNAPRDLQKQLADVNREAKRVPE